MNTYSLTLSGVKLEAMKSGALYWPDQRLLCVSDLHLGKSERITRLGGAMLRPYDTRETLAQLERDLLATAANSVICIGASFDDSASSRGISESDVMWITRMQAGRRWVWLQGNHDPGPLAIGGTHMAELPLPPLSFRHLARIGASGEISGHYHPKARAMAQDQSVNRPSFLIDSDRIIMPAYGAFSGGLQSSHEVLTGLMRPEAMAILTGPTLLPIPMPRD
ncbi:metallophosphoesterase, DNA ligase-associated [Thalassovita gelatinovora]|uniref:Metallophosphoesterase, DNA ligase-associated n=1 Tax=Thalassovita gelatinovora TaxID=53501 RepID=A0A0P1F8D2_THAGE|nr:ligase-associated DNA damage response endonuclease PdeM [Thalassovita gelatinovora]QIZ80325.1 ligase-associated DNA damage response endonuclease PdeM [Thalassovita gelatinovora]CUH64238.1 metallophosphoesterase, DNA ligase-associated [Thalassovita gelatinovora]SEQ94565.1 putative phosphoesterase [Thalassovita gelatinovora]